MKLLYTLTRLSVLTSVFALSISCDDFIEVDTPKNQISSDNVFSSDATANSAMSAIYAEMMSYGGFASGGFYSVTFLSGLSSDDLISTYSNDEIKGFYTNSILETNSSLSNYLWSEPYKFIYYANSVLEGLEKSNMVTDSVSNLIKGEAKFIRAFCHFYLVNMFGDVPVVLSTRFAVNTNLSRSAKEDVYGQIIIDLLDAQKILPESYPFSGERVRPNKYAALALLSRVYLYNSEWAKAEQYSSSVIENTELYDLVVDVNEVFKANSAEAIWQLRPVDPLLSREANLFVLTYEPVANGVYLNPNLIADFESDDARLINWVNFIQVNDKTYFYAYKYKLINDPNVEYSMVLRLAEQYFIRSEARAKQNKIDLAIEDLDVIRERAGEQLISDSSPDISQSELLSEIENERRREFFAEWGHRWFDLKRLKSNANNALSRADDVLLPLKGGLLWQSTDILYPIPSIQLQNDPNMTNEQNPGY